MKKNKKNKKKFNGYKIFAILLAISSIILFGVILFINILPLKYLAFLFLGLLLINLIFNFFLRRKVKKKPKKVFAALSVIFSIIFLLGAFYAYKTFGILDGMSTKYRTYTYHVVVNANSDYQELNDVKDKKIGYYNNNNDATKKARKVLVKKITFEEDSYGNLETLGLAVLNSETDAILLEDSDKTKLDNAGNSSESTLGGFAEKTRIIYTFKVKVPVKSKDVNVTKDVFNIYISGMDEYGKVSEVSRSDVNMIITVNPKTKQILLTNIPRDYFVKLHDTTGYNDKLTHAGIYGVETSIATIEDLLGIDINYYFKVNFSSLVDIVDALGGVEVFSEYDFTSYNGYNFSKGYNKVEGKSALAFVRERKTFNDGDNQRGKNQQAMIEAIFRKCTSPSIITKYNSLLNSLIDSMITNMPTKSIISLAKMQLRDNAKWSITSVSLKGTGSYEYTYTYPYQELYVMVPDEESVKTGQDMIAKVSEGEKLESSYAEDSSDVHSVSKSYVPKASTAPLPKKEKKKVVVKKAAPKKVAPKKEQPAKEVEQLPENKPEEVTPPTTPEEPSSPEEQNIESGTDNPTS